MSQLEQVNASIAAATHLTDMDKGAIELARRMARILDEAQAAGHEAEVKASYGPMATLNKVLDGLGLTPAGRKALAMTAPVVPQKSALEQLRSAPRPTGKETAPPRARAKPAASTQPSGKTAHDRSKPAAKPAASAPRARTAKASSAAD